jgi:hypothetical protein
VATIRISRARSQASACSVFAVTQGSLKTAPTDPRIASRWKTSVRGSATRSASTPAAHAVRAIAPRFPGRSTATATATSGSPDGTNAPRAVEGRRTTASRPSGRRSVRLANAAAPSSRTWAPDRSAATTRSASRLPTSRSGATYSSSTAAPEATAACTERAPSARQSPCAPRRASRRTAFSRALAELTMRGRRAKDYLEVVVRESEAGCLAATAAGGRATSTRRRAGYRCRRRRTRALAC